MLKKQFCLLSMLKIVVLLSFFMQTMIRFYQDYLISRKLQHSIYLK